MALPTQQTALAVLSKLGPWGLITVDVDQPAPGEVLIQSESAALNPIDWKVQAVEASSNYVSEYPAILGIDGAGYVVAVGDGVTKFAVGDRVFFLGFFTNRFGAFKQYSAVPADVVGKIPPTISFDEAASIPLGLSTAAAGLYLPSEGRGGAGLVAPWKGGRGKYAGQPIVVIGGSSSVGQYVIQLAKISGFSPIITTVSPRNDNLVKSIGATHTIDRKLSTDEIVAKVKAITSEPVKVVYDAISLASTQDTAYSVLAPGGILVLVLGPTIDKSKLDPKKKTISTFGSVYPEPNREFGRGLYGAATEYLNSGDLKPNSVSIIPGGLGATVEGLQRMQADQVSGEKLVVHPQETSPIKA